MADTDETPTWTSITRLIDAAWRDKHDARRAGDTAAEQRAIGKLLLLRDMALGAQAAANGEWAKREEFIHRDEISAEFHHGKANVWCTVVGDQSGLWHTVESIGELAASL